MTPLQASAGIAEFRFRAVGYSTDDLRVVAFEGAEGISELFHFRIRLCSEDAAIEPEAMLGLAAVLEVDGEHGTRRVQGIICRFERTGHGSRLTHYEATLVPPHWLLTRRIQSRVFNMQRCPRMDVIGIVSKVLTDAGLPAETLAVATTRPYEAREFTAQYRESDWDFVSRLLEEEGVYYFFEHGDDGLRLVLTDSRDLHKPFVDAGFEIPYRDLNGLVDDHEFVFAARRGDEVQIGAASLDDFNFRQPGTELRRSAAGARFSALALADFPGGYGEKGRGQRLTETRLEEHQCSRHVVTMSATVRGFAPGRRFTLVEHGDPRLNDDYLITSLVHRAAQPQSGAEEAGEEGSRYDVEIRALPARVQFRAPRCTPRPTVLGSQSAIVVGPPGEEIHTDEYGRIEVRFHWDQEAAFDVGASCWIRVSQGSAGGQYGMLFLPRVGQEVIVDFLEGDPDQPIITGRVYNRDHMPPYKLPDRRTVSAIRTCSSPGAGGGNEIRFEDARGKEQLLLFAQDSLHLRSRGNRFENVGGDAHATVAGDDVELVQKNKHLTVNLDLNEAVKGSKYLYVRDDIDEFVNGAQRTYVDQKYEILNRDGIRLHSETSITLWCQGNFIKLDASGVTIVGKMINLNSGGAADPLAPAEPVEMPRQPQPADTTESGHNTNYSAQTEPLAAVSIPPSEAKRTSWIEIELIDELGRPCPNEPYEIRLPDQQVLRGSLDGRGLAHVALSEPDLCEICFPMLDASAWEKIA